jgi:glycosyltransferase involved in cell wall biosynthesis
VSTTIGASAVCHEWALGIGGSERVTREIVDLLRPAAGYTLASDGVTEREVFGAVPVHVWRPGRVGAVQEHWTATLPLLAAAWRSADLTPYDLVVTSSHCFANAVRPRPDATLLSYSHTPMRYAWQWEAEIARVPAALRPAWPGIARALRRIDRRAAQRVDAFACNSRFVAEQIRQHYGRDATVIHPPVDVARFASEDPDPPERTHLLCAGRLVAYKRIDVAVRAATRARVPLVVAGDGPLRAELEAQAGPTVRFVGRVDDAELVALYRSAHAVVAPGVEDFGIGPVEAQASGTPVLARTQGGTAETVIDGTTGWLLATDDVEEWAAAMVEAVAATPDADACRAQAQRFAPEVFREAFGAFVAAHRS